MIAAYSTPGRIDASLRQLQKCSRENFVDIFRALGIRISSGQFSGIMSGQRSLDQETGARLLEILKRMKESEDEVSPVPVAWNRAEVVDALMLKLISNTTQEHERLAELAAKQAT